MESDTRLKRAAIRFFAAEAERDAAIREAADAGMPRREIAALTGTSVQRVHRALKADTRVRR